MGNVHSDRAGESTKETGAESKYAFISNESEEGLSFDPSQSYAVAFSINQQTFPRFKDAALGDMVVNDAIKVLSALVAKGTLPLKNIQQIEAKKTPDSCTFAGMKNAFQEQAKRVGKGGAFFFHFSGHGIGPGPINDQYGLVPVDFDITENTFITASVLTQWLHEAGCEAKRVVFTIECCHAGGFAEALTRGSDKLTPFPGLCVIAACTANEESVALGTLESSVFCFFLSHAIQTEEFSPGHFPVKRIYVKCAKLSTALSSLRIGGKIHPELAHSTQDLCEEGEEETDGEDQKFSYVAKLYVSKREGGKRSLHKKCLDWLKKVSKEGLSQLHEEEILEQERCVVDAVLCCMLRSVATIQLSCDPTTVASRNLYITAYMNVVTTINRMQPAVEFNLQDCMLGLEYYQDYLQNRKIETTLLNELYSEAKKLANRNGDDMTDSGEPVSQLP